VLTKRARRRKKQTKPSLHAAHHLVFGEESLKAFLPKAQKAATLSFWVSLCSLFSWGLPLLMLSVAAAFIYKERDAKISSRIINQIVDGESSNENDIHCW